MHKPKFLGCKYHSLDMIREEDLPKNWKKINSKNWSEIAPYWPEISKENTESTVSNDSIDNVVAAEINAKGCFTILELACGNGARLKNIRDKVGRPLVMYGTELSRGMAKEAMKKGLSEVKIRDIGNSLPYQKDSIDAVLILNGGFGYIMDKDGGKAERNRIEALKSIYSIVRPGGMLFLELLSCDNEKEPGNTVMTFERQLELSNGMRTCRFYIKQFTGKETEDLLKGASMRADLANIRYMVREGSKTKRPGEVVRGSQGFSSIYAGLNSIEKGTQYSLILSIPKAA